MSSIFIAFATFILNCNKHQAVKSKKTLFLSSQTKLPVFH